MDLLRCKFISPGFQLFPHSPLHAITYRFIHKAVVAQTCLVKNP
jgi:hypothetical protein